MHWYVHIHATHGTCIYWRDIDKTKYKYIQIHTACISVLVTLIRTYTCINWHDIDKTTYKYIKIHTIHDTYFIRIHANTYVIHERFKSYREYIFVLVCIMNMFVYICNYLYLVFENACKYIPFLFVPIVYMLVYACMCT